MSVLSGKRILLGVTGSIAAFKAADLASKLTNSARKSMSFLHLPPKNSSLRLRFNLLLVDVLTPMQIYGAAKRTSCILVSAIC